MMKIGIKQLVLGRELSPEDRRSVLEDLFVFGKDNQRPYLYRMSMLLVLSTIIATSGLLSDSAAVVIGAMLVAPMMNPVLAAAGAVVMGWPRRFYRAIWLVLVMGVAAVALSALITAFSPEIVFIPEQVLARTRPTYYDLLIALAAGSAGAYTITRKETSAIPGVAVAVALLPPLASAGVLTVAGEPWLAVRAMVLFLTNLVAMVLAGALTFLATGVSSAANLRRSATFVIQQLWLFALLVGAISVPLFFYSVQVLFNDEYLAAKSEGLQDWLSENEQSLTYVRIDRGRGVLHLGLEGPNPPVNIKDLYDWLRSEVERRGEDPDFSIDYTWTQRVDGTWPPVQGAIVNVAERDSAQEQVLLANAWRWRFTQYDAQSGSRAPEGDSYTLRFGPRKGVKVDANCGSRRGRYTIRGTTITVELRRFNWFSCRGDDAFAVFLGDIERGTRFFVEDDDLQVTLPTNSGVMHFERIRPGEVQ